ncbi:MAG: hypothetical protein PGN13_02885 [Patulibacter minatonensis]
MTHHQITAVRTTASRRRPCCNGLAQVGWVGRPSNATVLDAAEVEQDLRGRRIAYFALIDGEFVDITIDHCSTCGAPFMTGAGDRSPYELGALSADVDG